MWLVNRVAKYEFEALDDAGNDTVFNLIETIKDATIRIEITTATGNTVFLLYFEYYSTAESIIRNLQDLYFRKEGLVPIDRYIEVMMYYKAKE